MERPIFKPLGTPVEELDTPTLVVDADVLERNIETMASFFANSRARLRPHVESHLCPTIAHKQLTACGTVGGIAVTTLGQAEVFAANGFSDISVTNVLVTPQKIARLCALARHASMTVAVDDAKNVDDLSEAASQYGVTLTVIVDVHTRLDRCGVEPGRPAVELANAVARSEGLDFAGLMTYEGTILEEDPEMLANESRKWIQMVLDTREMVEKAGIDVRVVSVGGTHNYEIAASIDGVTEVPAGTYALMDHRYAAHRTQFEPAARVISAVTSIPEPGIVITDAGQKAVGADTGLPSIDNIPGATVHGLSAEHGNLDVDPALHGRINLEDRVWMTPWDIGTCVNLHDYMSVVRDGRLEAVWEVSARGRYR